MIICQKHFVIYYYHKFAAICNIWGKQHEKEIAECNAFLTKMFFLSMCLYCSDI